MNKRELIRLHKRLCKELGITPCRIVFRKYARFARGAYAGYWPWENQITLYSESMRKDKIDAREAVAHETYHHAQFKRGWLDGLRWRGTPYEKWDDIKYHNKPWEAGAFRYQNKIRVREGWGESTV
jgi:hypothetical protein